MKRALIIIFIFSCFCCNAQNYQCFQNGVTNYFTNSNNYLRGIRIDSTITSGDTTIYYPFHTIRNQHGPVIDSNGGSWLGKKVLALTNGTYTFDTYWGNPLTIQTQSIVGDFWILYQDTSSRYYGASLAAIDTMTVLGVLDSIKLIKIIAIEGSTIATSDPLNNLEIILSRNFGFVKIFDLYMFPYHPAGSPYVHGTDYFYDNCGSQIFNLVNFIKPPNTQVYDFNVGDYFEFHGYAPADRYNEVYFIDTITAKDILSPDSITYIIHTKNYIQYFDHPGWAANGSSVHSLNATSSVSIANISMPEETEMRDIVHYSQNDSSDCLTCPNYAYSTNYMLYGEPCGSYSEYKIGFGKTAYGHCYDATPGPGSSESYQMIYSYKNGQGYGSYHALPTEIDEVSTQRSIGIFPNPATAEIMISATDKINDLTICNFIGQLVFVSQYDAKNIKVNVRSLPPGVYFIKINNLEVHTFVKQ